MDELKNKEIFSQNLRSLMDKNNKDRNQICDDLGLKYTTFTDWVNGKKYPRIDKIELLANYFKVRKSDLIEDQSQKENKFGADIIDLSNMKRIPILGRIRAGMPIYAAENIEGYTLTDLNGGAEYFGLRVTGDSMNAARIHEGDIVIVRRQDIVENGQIAVVLIDGQDATLKRFNRDGNIVTLMPQSTNPKNKALTYNLKNSSVKILGLVVRVEFEPM